MSRIFFFKVKQRSGERSDDWTEEIRAEDERAGVLRLVAWVAYTNTFQSDEAGALELAQAKLVEEYGAEWTPQDVYDGHGLESESGVGEYSEVYFYAPYQVFDSEEEMPAQVAVRAFDRYRDEGMIEHLHGRLMHVVEALSTPEVEALFGEDIHTQRELEKGGEN